MIEKFHTTTTFMYLFPELKSRYGFHKKVDLRCGFSKEFLYGKLKGFKPSTLHFYSGNRLTYDLSFGCGVYVYKKG